MNMCVLYITYPSKEEAVKISRILIEEKLVACVNIFDSVLSMYEWEGELVSEQETAVITKTCEQKVDDVIERVKALHMYDCPCIISMEVKKGNKDFVKWVENSIKVE